ncbi:MAG: hypothetical protein GY859_12865 [Desulfobacterales bacterium]|nr:hypothetical protein [Desulfobacterales bacterium]
MKRRRTLLNSVMLLMVSSALLMNGCAYMEARGRDALDILEIGVTITDKAEPDFAFYFDFFNITPVGYAKVDGKVLGIGNRQIGWLDHSNQRWGLLAAGEERETSGVFNPKDPHLTRADHRDVAELPTYNSGVVRLASQGNPPPTLQFFE